MMGNAHLTVGGAAWLAAGVPLLSVAGVPLEPAEIGAGCVVASGAAMLPDLDHPSATVSRSLGPVTWVLSRVLAKVSGGHRNGTHSFLFALLVSVGVLALLQNTTGPWAALGVSFFFSSLVVRVLTEAEGVVCAIVSAVVAATVITIAPSTEWLYLAVGFGCVAHMLGDVLTPQGVPAFWPVWDKRFSIGVIGHTGDWREKVCHAVAGAVAVYFLATMIFAPLWEKREVESVQAQSKQEASLDKVPAGDKVSIKDF